MTVKESFDVEGLPTTWGYPNLKSNIAKQHALSVHRLLGAGAVVFGKTNVPVGLSDWQTFNPVYGTTNNPWDLTRVPGGSSGGAAAALATGLTGLELGSDIGASIRGPAHYCGVFGHKPTFGLCPVRGHNLPLNLSTKDMAVIGPLSRSAGDLELALRIIGQPDERDARGIRVALAKPKVDIRSLRVAVLPSALTAQVDDTVQAGVLAAAQCFAKAGAKVSDKARPDFDLHDAHRTYVHLLRAATSSAPDDKQFAALRRRSPRVSAKDDRYEAWMIRATTMTHREWHVWHEKREWIRQKWTEFFQAQSGRRALATHDSGQWQTPADNDAVVLGRILRHGLSAFDSCSGRVYRGPFANWCADYRTTLWRLAMYWRSKISGARTAAVYCA